MRETPDISTSAADLSIGIVVSRYHHQVTDALLRGAIDSFLASGGCRDQLLVVEAPGSFELIALAAELASNRLVDAIVALGCVITGETTHDQHIANAVANGLASLTVQSGIPIAFGVLTCQSLQQAEARAGGGKGNKGAESMRAAIAAVNAIHNLQQNRSVR